MRQTLSDKYLSGRGIEIGAGLSPTRSANISELVFVDKRTEAEFEALFKSAPPYEIVSLDEARSRFPEGVDFIVAHHVIEHCANPIKVLAEQWLPLLKKEGILYLSLPRYSAPCERQRIVAPIKHLLDDYYFNRDDLSFESKEHIYPNILQWTVLSTDNFHYAKDTVQHYASGVLDHVRFDCHDLHWHTYSMETIAKAVEAALYTARAGVEWLARAETDDDLHIVCLRTSAGPMPECIRDYRARLSAALARL